MKAFARLLERLVFTPPRNAKLRLLEDYFATTPDPDRGWALAALAGGLELPAVTPSRVRGLVEERVDPVLFRLSYDFVGDLAETVALIWPAPEDVGDDGPPLGEVVASLRGSGPVAAGQAVAALCDRLGASERVALIKLVAGGGGMRVGVSARLARTALARWSGRPLERIEELWFGVEPPYQPLFAWLEGGPEPDLDLSLAFRPMLLSNPVEGRLKSLDPAAYAAEWKWDGIRVQAAALGGRRRLYTRTGDDIGRSFPDVIETMAWEGAVDGELLVVREGEVAPFAELQKRLGRKQVSPRMTAANPAHLRLYDILHDGRRDVRALPLDQRRAILEDWHARFAPSRTDLSPRIAFERFDELHALRDSARAAGQEGLMLKRRDSPYTGGRPMGPWFKWKRDPLSADCVLVYAQRGHGKRSSFYSDYTFAAWREGPEGEELVPVGKAYSGYTDDELVVLDRWIRNNTAERFGPVRSVRPALVLEIAFDAVQRSGRHKSGIAMRFPRIKRIRWDKPAAEADRLATLEALVEAPARVP
ncbi:MAG TPA: cisplatin damage response ATP-dependent DNA ligase [Thermohalobaculum sp.]|nr:cisplatin damage response ATP-dependent DNA ligase [Thermohalobaculum sp.]